MKVKQFTLCFAAIIMLAGCADDDTKEITGDRIVGTWKLTGWYDDTAKDIDGDGNASTDLYSQWTGCRKNNTLILNSDFTSKMKEPGNVENDNCEIHPDDFDYNYLPWKFTVNEDDNTRSIEFIGDDFFDSYQIIEASSNTLILKGSSIMTCCNPDISYYTDGYLKFTRE